MLWLLTCCKSISKHTYADVYTLNAKYYNYINFILRKLSKFCNEYNSMIIKVFNIFICELNKSKGIPNILKYP